MMGAEVAALPCLPASQPGVEIQRTTPHRTAPEPGGNRGARCKRSGPGLVFLFFSPTEKNIRINIKQTARLNRLN